MEIINVNDNSVWTQTKIRKYVESFLAKNFDGLTLDVPIRFNGRLTRCLGKFQYYPTTNQSKSPISIEFSKKFLKFAKNEDEIVGVIKHEAIHYALYMLNLPHKDSDDMFVDYCKKLGASLTREVSIDHWAIRKIHMYKCQGCGYNTSRQRRFNTSRYGCPHCYNYFEYVGTLEI